ncbi:gliding motility-associated C-terminal domain-containing protein [Pedobacter psychrodurus]|uniref:Gliding motility-associated C-terminal domain-containing protein n=1 Tax=Pedobacter psychrodurus TaxID=2530456 RepID=A0A4V2MPB7_9SPHI|nr:gliding motility-associated C-terminal domain-containing protein [Pedobacter psychrodurus]TCD18108.1 gliding motility-associated C-terminal domain-containing protein [Pedobacter psychrodurus]
MRNNILNRIRFFRQAISLLAILIFTICAKAQTGSGSMTVDNSTVTISAGTTESRFSEGTYFGPNANWTIDGTLEIYSKNVWIAPGATFNGSGRIIIYNPGDNPFYIDMIAGPTRIDGNNGAFINLIIEHRNTDNITLADVTDPGYSTTNPTGVQGASLNIGGTLDMAADKADIILNGYNLTFNASGKITNFSESRMVVTGNSIIGHMVKDFSSSTAFVYPIGIAEGDYTPATLSPQAASRIFVSVQDYNAANTIGVTKLQGIDRTWNIYASVPVQTTITLQHNQNTNGAKFKDATASVTQYLGNSKWDIVTGTNPSLGVHTRVNVAVITDMLANGASFTKHSINGADLFIPNLFTPNGDSNNDTFEIRGLNLFAENDLVIVNRWGNEVYKANNYQNNWTGEGLNEGTYYYLLRVKENAGAPWQVFKGYITLIRAFKR